MELVTQQNKSITKIVEEIRQYDVMCKDDADFLMSNQKHLAKVFENVYMWRTDWQKRSIISDDNFPTTHAKFHQAILEQKVQLDQAFYLAKDFEQKKLDIEELECEIEELNEIGTKKSEIQRRKKELDISFKKYELDQMKIAMNYRMSEVQGWQTIQDELLIELKTQGMKDTEIWNKSTGEVESYFFLTLTMLKGILKSTDGGEVNNLTANARYAVQHAKQVNLFDAFLKKANREHLEALEFLGIIKIEAKQK